MSTFSLIRPTSGSLSTVASSADLGAIVTNVLGNQPTNWEVRVSEADKWVVVAGKNTLREGQGHIFLVPRTRALMSSSSLLALWSAIWMTNANLTFESDISFLYDHVTIIGASDIESGISESIETELRSEGRTVERLDCRTAQEMTTLLNERFAT